MSRWMSGQVLGLEKFFGTVESHGYVHMLWPLVFGHIVILSFLYEFSFSSSTLQWHYLGARPKCALIIIWDILLPSAQGIYPMPATYCSYCEVPRWCLPETTLLSIPASACLDHRCPTILSMNHSMSSAAPKSYGSSCILLGNRILFVMIYSFSLSKCLLSYLIFRIRDSTESSHHDTVTLGHRVFCLSLSNTVYLLLGHSL